MYPCHHHHSSFNPAMSPPTEVAFFKSKHSGFKSPHTFSALRATGSILFLHLSFSVNCFLLFLSMCSLGTFSFLLSHAKIQCHSHRIKIFFLLSFPSTRSTKRCHQLTTVVFVHQLPSTCGSFSSSQNSNFFIVQAPCFTSTQHG